MLAYIKMSAMQNNFELIDIYCGLDGYNPYKSQELLVIDPSGTITMIIVNKISKVILFEANIEVDYEKPVAFTTPLVYDICFDRLKQFINKHTVDKILKLKANNMLITFMVSDDANSITYNDFDIYHRNRNFQVKSED